MFNDLKARHHVKNLAHKVLLKLKAHLGSCEELSFAVDSKNHLFLLNGTPMQKDCHVMQNPKCPFENTPCPKQFSNIAWPPQNAAHISQQNTSQDLHPPVHDSPKTQLQLVQISF